ncbi:MAG TPA: hypothetical protein H9857_06765 [Candidatus Desulfovibrio intestinigallinarum]|nr:hypothetical protein [Candidatus Desulfovibrio intestinigallinarum]
MPGKNGAAYENTSLTTVNVTQQQAASAQAALSPRDALAEIVRQSAGEYDEDEQEQRA